MHTHRGRLSAPLRCFIHWSARRVGCRLVHAAVVGQGDEGVVIAGGGGAGKSTTTVAGIVDGLTTVGDDYVLVGNGSPPKARAVFSTIKLDLAGLQRIGAAHFADEHAPNWQCKFELTANRIRLNTQANELALKAILIPDDGR